MPGAVCYFSMYPTAVDQWDQFVASRGPEHHHSLGTVFDEEAAVFFVEQLVVVAVEK